MKRITSAGLVLLAVLFASVTLRAQSPPANDNFANRQVLPSQNVVTVSGTTNLATQEAFEVVYGDGEPYGDGINERETVWYDYTAPADGVLKVNITRNTEFLTYCLVFMGADTPVAANIVTQGYLPDGAASEDGFPPPSDFAVRAGQEMTISLGNSPQSQSIDNSFVLTLTLTPVATPIPTPVGALPLVSVAAKGKAERGSGTPGKFVVTLSAASASALTVNYKTGGSAVGGTDYKPLSGSVTFAAGATSATLKVKPRAGTTAAAVKLTLEAGDGYTVGSEAGAKVKIVGDP